MIRLFDLKNKRQVSENNGQTQERHEQSLKFAVLPKVLIVIFLNDRDEELAPQYTLLFEKRAEHYLAAECLAMLGRHLLEELLAN